MGQSKKQADEVQEAGIELASFPVQIQKAIDELLAKPVSAGDVALASWNRVMAADDPESGFASLTPVSSEDYIGKAFTVLAITLRPSNYAGSSFYGSIEAVTGDGEPIVVNTSSIDALTKLVAFHTKGWLPMSYPVQFEEAPTAAGFTASSTLCSG